VTLPAAATSWTPDVTFAKGRVVLKALGLGVALVVWARATEARVALPGFRLPWLGGVLVLAGVVLAAQGIRDARRCRETPGHDRSPAARLTRHPVHIGLVILTFGVALFTGSSSGLWLVSPITALVAAAWAHRRDGSLRRRGRVDGEVEPPLLRLPPDDGGVPTAWSRLSVFILVFIPWTVAYEAAFLVGIPPDAVLASFPFERDWPVLVWTEAIYASVYIIVLAATLGARENRVLRHLSVTALIATAVVPIIYVTVPVISPPRPFVSDSLLGTMLEMERAMSHTAAAFPAFHVIWTLIAAEALAATAPRLKGLTYVWAIAVSASCITTGMHALVDVAFAVAVFTMVRSYAGIRKGLGRALEIVASSSREWSVGAAKFGSHGVFAGLAVATGAWIAMALGGPPQRGIVTAAFTLALVAAVWMRRREGWPPPRQSLHYLGILTGAVSGVAAAGLRGTPVLLLPTALAVAAPWIHAIGRLGGSAAGSAEPAASRVDALLCTRLSTLFASVVVGVLLARLWKLGAAMSLILGLYLMLTGLARYVEETRPRPWVGLFSAGVVVSCLPSGPAPDSSGWLLPGTALAALAMGLLAALAVGLEWRHEATRPEALRRSA
jgi:hypothetical protein